MTQIKAVTPKEDYRLEVALENGSSVSLDFANRLQTIRFCPLANRDLFARAGTDGTLITWDRQVEISISEVFQLAQKWGERLQSINQHSRAHCFIPDKTGPAMLR